MMWKDVWIVKNLDILLEIVQTKMWKYVANVAEIIMSMIVIASNQNA